MDMPKLEIEIIVRGGSGTGMTTIAEIIDMTLSKQGFRSDLVREFPDEHGPHREATFKHRVDVVKQTVNITIIEQHKRQFNCGDDI